MRFIKINYKIVYQQIINRLSRGRESNPRPADYKSAALPTELPRLIFIKKNLSIFSDGKSNRKQIQTKFLLRNILFF